MCTSIVVLALMGFMKAPAPDSPTWLTDYRTALAVGKEKGKPLAVVFGSGKEGWNQLSKNGTLTPDVLRLLGSEYVCVYVDCGRKANKAVADAFEVSESTGLVISDRTGGLQAFRHEGDLSDARLLQYLERYAERDLVVRTTYTNPGSEEEAPQPAYQPVYRPVFYGGGFGGFGGGGGC